MIIQEFVFEMQSGMNEFDHRIFALLGQGPNFPSGMNSLSLSCSCIIGTQSPFPVMLNEIYKLGKAIKIGNPIQIKWRGCYA